MTPLISLLSALVLCITLTSCDHPSITDVEQDIHVNNSIENTEKLETLKKHIIDSNSEDYSSNHLDDWEPYMVQTPISQNHQPFEFSRSNIEQIKTYFFEDIIVNESTIKSLIDNDYIFEGYISSNDHSILNYSFIKEGDIYLGKEFYLAGNYKLRQKLTGSYKDTVYKMLEISGVDNPDQFLQQLLASPKITKYTGCTVQLKPVKYGVIDLTSCEDDDATVLALYNPKPI